MKKTEIVKDKENEIPVKIMEQAIVDVANAAKALNAARIKQRAIILLIQDYIGPQRITKSQVKEVLDAAESLGRVYLK